MLRAKTENHVLCLSVLPCYSHSQHVEGECIFRNFGIFFLPQEHQGAAEYTGTKVGHHLGVLTGLGIGIRCVLERSRGMCSALFFRVHETRVSQFKLAATAGQVNQCFSNLQETICIWPKFS